MHFILCQVAKFSYIIEILTANTANTELTLSRYSKHLMTYEIQTGQTNKLSILSQFNVTTHKYIQLACFSLPETETTQQVYLAHFNYITFSLHQLTRVMQCLYYNLK